MSLVLDQLLLQVVDVLHLGLFAQRMQVYNVFLVFLFLFVLILKKRLDFVSGDIQELVEVVASHSGICGNVEVAGPEEDSCGKDVFLCLGRMFLLYLLLPLRFLSWDLLLDLSLGLN